MPVRIALLFLKWRASECTRTRPVTRCAAASNPQPLESGSAAAWGLFPPRRPGFFSFSPLRRPVRRRYVRMGVVVPVERLRKHPCPPAIQYVSWMDGWTGGWMEGRLLGRRVQDSTSGMASAGRIKFHVRSTLPRAGAAAAARTDTRLGHLHGSSHLAAPGLGLAGCQLLPRHAPPRCRVLGSVTRPLGRLAGVRQPPPWLALRALPTNDVRFTDADAPGGVDGYPTALWGSWGAALPGLDSHHRTTTRQHPIYLTPDPPSINE